MDLSALYRDSILRLLPKGKIWNAEEGSFIFRMAHGLADELARLHLRAFQLVEEADPRTTQEMLADWERALGLPDTCCPQGQSTAQRRNEVVLRFKGGHGQSPQAFIDTGLELGYTVTVKRFFFPFQVGRSVVGDALTNGDWLYTFQVTAANHQVTSSFKVGRNVVGDPLGNWGNTELECKVRAAAPAHAIVLFVYT